MMGDIAKEKIKYVRNFTFDDVNTIKIDPMMPYHDKRKPFVNKWFSSSDGYDVNAFIKLCSKKNIDRLEKERGACVVYTHFASGFVNENGELNDDFKKCIDYISTRNGWFVPCGQLLDYLEGNQTSRVGRFYLLKLNAKWLIDRCKKFITYGE
ncbi:hypothetical protein [Vibrio scophthalmi]|uniref:Uncharacterized protein n=1 Tax=Vibrio scophthalmi TaxID=45658 RepID=A0A1E3WJ09_9VIBR|nr:hypothetical protein [Vibrio scophthalmi]ODS09753.1 hypothetical protein VSF3289_03215 [Vibrio scophthalmi]